MKRITIILILIIVAIDGFCSLPDTSSINKTYAINIESLIIRDLKFTYTHKLKKQLYFETMLSINVPYGNYSNFADVFNMLFASRDPFVNYGRVQLRLGIKKYHTTKKATNRFFTEPMLLYGYGYFYDKFSANSFNSEFYQCVTRNKHEFGFLMKTGMSFYKKHLFQEIYFGVGFRYKLLYDIVYHDGWEDTNSPLPHPPYPYNSNDSYGIVTIHFGYQIGHCN